MPSSTPLQDSKRFQESIAMVTVRAATLHDLRKVQDLYLAVARQGGGIDKTDQEISTGYIKAFMKKSRETGFEFVVDHPTDPKKIIGEIHCYRMKPAIFHHVCNELYIVIHPDFQGQGIGRKLFSHLLELIKSSRPDICRVELSAGESNQRAIELYKKLGFKIEGKLEKRARNMGVLEAEIYMGWINPNYQEPR